MKSALLQSDRTRIRAQNLRWWVALFPALLFILANAVLFVLCFVLPFATAVRIVYGFNTLAMPLVLLLTGALLFRLTRSAESAKKLRRVATFWTITGLMLFGLRVYATHIEPHRLQIREVTIASAKVREPLTVLHITDIQSAGIGAYEARVFEKIRALDPDIILHTGDLLQPISPRTHKTELPKVAALFESLPSACKMYMVQGDTCGPMFNAQPEDTGGIAYLHDTDTVITRPNDRIRIYGLTLGASTLGTQARDEVDRWLQADPDAFNIVMGHRPDYILKMNDLPIDLCLAGHTHGGQIRIPFFGPPIIFSHIPRDWARGFRETGSTRLNVSAGIGAEHAHRLPSIRINCPPEMTLIHVVPENSFAADSERP